MFVLLRMLPRAFDSGLSDKRASYGKEGGISRVMISCNAPMVSGRYIVSKRRRKRSASSGGGC